MFAHLKDFCEQKEHVAKSPNRGLELAIGTGLFIDAVFGLNGQNNQTSNSLVFF